MKNLSQFFVFVFVGVTLSLMSGVWSRPDTAAASDSPGWPSWRGPEQTGVSRETGLVDSWSPEGENLLWKAPVGGRSTPIVLNGRVYVITLGGKEKLHRHERVICLDAETGELIWEHGFNVFLTDIPWHRVGWASLAGDPETGYIYAHGIGGMFICFDRDGKIIWSRSLTEEFGRISGYGGRTHTPIVDEDLVILSFLNAGWGEQARGAHRYFAFQKRTGELVWVSQPGGRPFDTTYSVPVVVVIQGQRLLIAGNADGAVYAMKVRTGEKVWGFQLSKRGINSSVVVEGTRVYASHSEENVDGSTEMGRLVCIDGTGKGDVTQTHKVWQVDGFGAGYASPALHDGRLYHIDNSANLHSFDTASGRLLWKLSLGTVQKGSPVWADGKLYVSEVDGKFYILQPGEKEGKILDRDEFMNPDGSAVQINGSPAIANGRVYLSTRNALYCIGRQGNKFGPVQLPGTPAEEKGKAAPAWIRVVPAEVVLQPGESRSFAVEAFDSQGRAVGRMAARWGLQNLQADLQEGRLTVGEDSGPQAGTVQAVVADMTASSRVRVIGSLPLQEDFEGIEVGKVPAHWIAAAGKFVVEDHEGSRVLRKLSRNPRFWRTNVFLGLPTMRDYTIQADLKATARRRRVPDMGLIANRYILDMKGSQQRLQIRTWPSELRMAKTIDFSWKPDVWYRVKFRAETSHGKVALRAKIWPREGPEPDAWTLETQDPRPNREGSPGLYGYSRSAIYYDNVIVSRNTQ